MDGKDRKNSKTEMIRWGNSSIFLLFVSWENN